MAAPVRVETSLERRGRSGWKELVPKEHGVWGWLGIPLAMALASAPAPSTLAAALAVVAGLGAAHGLGRVMAGAQRARAPAGLALLFANLFGALAVAGAARPGIMLVTLGGGALVGFGAMAYLRGRMPRRVEAEVATILAFVLLAFGLALAGGSPAARVAVAAGAVLAWLLLGLWWVKRSLALVLSHRAPWRHGAYVAGAATLLSIALGLALGAPWVGFLPGLYPLRVLLHRAPAHARDAKRVGLSELGWGLAVAIVAALA